MTELTSIDRANESNYLWAPIADSVDTFLRRREDADGYERIWRLIHVWESIVTTLTAVAVTRMRDCQADDAIYFKARELLHGVSWNAIDNRLKSSQGALDGGNDKRIEILRLV